MAGQGTIGLELLDDIPNLDAVVVPTGGGGMLSGIAMAVKGKNPKTRGSSQIYQFPSKALLLSKFCSIRCCTRREKPRNGACL